MSDAPRITMAGDSTLLIRFDERIDVAVNRRVERIARLLVEADAGGIRDVVPTFRSVGVFFDPLKTDAAALRQLVERISAAASGQDLRSTQPPGVHTAAAEDDEDGREPILVPVLYGGDEGPDLGAVAAFARLRPADVIDLHCGRTYRVFMIGFVPGFAYLAPVDERIAMPRLESPRTRVPAGSIGIAGAQTGIYPSETPGGWRLIGRTDFRPFDPARADPFALKVGDRVRFYPAER
jgi:KipI family sensor histidine kinase inhibitor